MGEFYSLYSATGKYYTHKKQRVGTHILIVYCCVPKINGREARYYEQIYCKNYTKLTLSQFLNNVTCTSFHCYQSINLATYNLSTIVPTLEACGPKALISSVPNFWQILILWLTLEYLTLCSTHILYRNIRRHATIQFILYFTLSGARGRLLILNPLEHSVVSDATGVTIRFNMQSSARRLRHRCRLFVILAFCQ